MTSRPSHLTQERADRFKDQSVVDAYPLRWPYPGEMFEVLAGLMVCWPGIALDAGTGTGDIARPLVARAGRVDAVDVSAAMLARARTMPGGDHPGLRWIQSRMEDYVTTSRYALVTAGESLHWMDWGVALPRFREMLLPGGMLAIVQRSGETGPWQDGLNELIATWSTVRDYAPFDLVMVLEQRALFEVKGRHRTAPIAFRQSVSDYIESFHSSSSLSRNAMSPESAAAFDEHLRILLEPWSKDGFVVLHTIGDVVWGYPLSG
jgi:ubiquinone/menaquinone biosynthesis C-methylase UbiE